MFLYVDRRLSAMSSRWRTTTLRSFRCSAKLVANQSWEMIQEVCAKCLDSFTKLRTVEGEITCRKIRLGH